MRILLIRHADPDYEKDSLTDAGWVEAECLADRLEKEKIDFFYVSPLGRARDTASVTLRRLGREAEVLSWLREFDPQIWRPDDTEKRHICWDWLPEDMSGDGLLYSADGWLESAVMREGGVFAGGWTGFWRSTGTSGRGDFTGLFARITTCWRFFVTSAWGAYC